MDASAELSDAEFDLLGSMIDSFVEDVDSWCNSSIACCDACFDEYSAMWPLAYTTEHGLQYQSVPASLFYASARRVQGTVTTEEFTRLLRYVACPNCSGPLGPNLYAFELPFHPERFEDDLKRLGELARNAPFLLLADEFAQRIKDEIFELGRGTEPALPDGTFFRGRDIESSVASIADFGPPPAAKTKEGRYNHAGRPVLYLADEEATCWEECRRPDGPFSIASFAFTRPVRILDLSEPEEMKGIMAPVLYSNLAAAPSNGQGWDRPEYILTRFVADCARVAKIDAIRYLSTRTGRGTNVALLKGETAMDHVKLTSFKSLVKRSFR
jgi:hypothetical protein